MIDLLNELEAGKPVRVPLTEGQSARGLRVAISRAATSRGLDVETLEGDGFVAVRKVDPPRGRKGTQASADGVLDRAPLFSGMVSCADCILLARLSAPHLEDCERRFRPT